MNRNRVEIADNGQKQMYCADISKFDFHIVSWNVLWFVLPVVNSFCSQNYIHFLKMIVRLKISRCLLPESGKTNTWSMLWRASRARYMILVSVGFDNSPPKPLSSGLLKCLRRVSTFSSLFILYDSSFKVSSGSFGFPWCCM